MLIELRQAVFSYQVDHMLILTAQTVPAPVRPGLDARRHRPRDRPRQATAPRRRAVPFWVRTCVN